MRYLIGHYHHNPTLESDRISRLRRELSNLHVTRADSYTCTIESDLEAAPLVAYLRPFLDPGEWFVLVNTLDGTMLREERPAHPG